MLKLVRQLHIYAGLLGFASLILFGMVGIYASFTDHEGGPEPIRDVVAFEFPADTAPEAERMAVARLVMERFGGPHFAPLRDYMVEATGERTYQVRLHGPSDQVVADVDLSEGTAELARTTRELGAYAVEMHATSPLDRPALVVLLWSLYIELSIFFLGFLALSGFFLWLSSRPTHRGAWIASAAGVLLTVALLLVLWI